MLRKIKEERKTTEKEKAKIYTGVITLGLQNLPFLPLLHGVPPPATVPCPLPSLKLPWDVGFPLGCSFTNGHGKSCECSPTIPKSGKLLYVRLIP